jgi:hypothetical protein
MRLRTTPDYDNITHSVKVNQPFEPPEQRCHPRCLVPVLFEHGRELIKRESVESGIAVGKTPAGV